MNPKQHREALKRLSDYHKEDASIEVQKALAFAISLIDRLEKLPSVDELMDWTLTLDSNKIDDYDREYLAQAIFNLYTKLILGGSNG